MPTTLIQIISLPHCFILNKKSIQTIRGDLTMTYFSTKRVNLIIVLTLLVCGSTLAQFTADMVQTQEGETTTTKLYVENPLYRMDIEEEGKEGYVIVDQSESITKVVMPSDKMYMEMGARGMMSMSNDVFQSIEQQKEIYDTNHLGNETINGYECEKYQIIIDGNVVTTFWQSSQLEYPLKVISGPNNERVMELKNINEGDIDDSMFQIPEGYTKIER